MKKIIAIIFIFVLLVSGITIRPLHEDSGVGAIDPIQTEYTA